jgi:hypothetical protein
MSAAKQCCTSTCAILHKTHICSISLKVAFYLHALLRKVKMGNRKGLYSQMRKHTRHISAGVAHALRNYSFDKFVAFANDKPIWVIACHDSVKSKVSTEQAGFHKKDILAFNF